MGKDLLLEEQIQGSAQSSIANRFVRLGKNVPGVLYEPQNAASPTAVFVMHSDGDYLSFSAGKELAQRGHRVLCANVSNPRGDFNQKIRDAGYGISFLYSMPQVEKVVLLGHSGGGSLMTAYQSIAEHGPSFFQASGMLAQCPNDLDGLRPADGVMLLDTNWGNGAMRLFSLDPAIADETDSRSIDPSLDLFNPANGFDPSGSTYSDEFIKRFLLGQHRRNTRLTEYALERLHAIEHGKGRYNDDEPFVVPGAEQGFFNNKLYAQDIRLMARTRKEARLLHGDGSETRQIVHSLRGPENSKSFTASLGMGALITTVRNYLRTFAVRTAETYGYDADSVYGIDWASSYNCATGNVRGVTVPLLVMGMTGGWEFASAETLCEQAASADKTLAFVEGANHFFQPCKHLETADGQFGDTLKVTYDYVNEWMSERF